MEYFIPEILSEISPDKTNCLISFDTVSFFTLFSGNYLAAIHTAQFITIQNYKKT